MPALPVRFVERTRELLPQLPHRTGHHISSGRISRSQPTFSRTRHGKVGHRTGSHRSNTLLWEKKAASAPTQVPTGRFCRGLLFFFLGGECHFLRTGHQGPPTLATKTPHFGGADIYRTGYPLLQAGGGGHNVCRGSCTYGLADGVSGSHADLTRCSAQRTPVVGGVLRACVASSADRMGAGPPSRRRTR